MSTIDIKLKTYDQLVFEITRLNTDKYLLEQKLKQKENIIKEVREAVETGISEDNYDGCIYDIKNILDKGE